MGVSRTPVREAIRKLELEGWSRCFLEKEPRCELSVKDIMDVWRSGPPLTVWRRLLRLKE